MAPSVSAHTPAHTANFLEQVAAWALGAWAQLQRRLQTDPRVLPGAAKVAIALALLGLLGAILPGATKPNGAARPSASLTTALQARLLVLANNLVVQGLAGMAAFLLVFLAALKM